MLSQRRSSDSFEWEDSLEAARTAFLDRDGAAASKLFKALKDAAKMAEHCHDQLLDLEPGRLPQDDPMLVDWRNFLSTLYNDMWKVYKTRIDLVKSATGGSLLTTYNDVGRSTRAALYGVKYMDTESSEAEGRERAVESLQKLITVLQAAVAELESKPPPAHQVARNPQNVVSDEPVYVRLVGRIAAGGPTVTDEIIEDSFPLPRQLVGEGTLFILRITGDSMSNVGIIDGDWVVVREQQTAENGEIVVALLDGETTVKTFKRSGGHVWLVPQNQAYQEKLGDQATIQGKVVTVLRRL